MAEKAGNVATIRVVTIRVLTVAQEAEAGTPPESGDDSDPNREPPEGFRVVTDGQDPNRGATESIRSVEDRQDPKRGASESFRSVGDGQDPNRGAELDEQGCSGSSTPFDANDANDANDATDALGAIDAQLLDHVWRIAQSAARHCDALMKLAYEYSLPQILVLRAIVAGEQAGRPALCASEVARELQCSRANVTEIVAALVRMRTLTKRRDPTNGRIVRLYPTPSGRLTEFHARAQLADDAARAFATLEGPDKPFLLALLQKVASLP
jgi:DNA-binding MarR family transcriptional regulator